MKLSNIKSSERELYIQNELLGMESRALPSEVNEKRASYMKNILQEDGISRKRHGWRELYSFYDENDTPLRVNGIFEYKGARLVHAGTALYKCEGGCEKISSSIALANENSCAFENEGLLYIVSGGELIIYDGMGLQYAYDSQYAYVPTTCVEVSPIGYEETGKKNEESNYLTGKRINTLIGVGKEGGSYLLDGQADLTKELLIKTKMSIALTQSGENAAPYFAYYNSSERLLKDNINGISGLNDKDAIYKMLSGEGITCNIGEVEEVILFLKEPMKIDSAIFSSNLGNTVPRVAFSLNGEVFYDTGKTSEYRVLDLSSSLYGQVFDSIYFYGNHDNGIIDTVNIQGRLAYEGKVEIIHTSSGISYGDSIAPTSILSSDGKELTLCRNVSGSKGLTPIAWLEEGRGGNSLLGFNFNNIGMKGEKCNIEVTYYEKGREKPKFYIGGVSKSNTGGGILALSGDESCIYLSSGRVGFCYFPNSLKIKLGSYGKISAICKMADSTLAVYKENEAYNIAIKSNKEGEEIEVTGYSASLGSLSHFATVTVNNDTLCPTRRGIFGSVGYEKDGFFERSGNIAGELKKYNLRKALACESQGRYYLFIDGVAFVADSKYKFNGDNSSFEYEWWMLDNCPASCVCTINGEILMGREDGRIVAFYDGFKDILYTRLDTGDYLLREISSGSTALYLNEGLGAQDGDRVIINGGYRHLGFVKGYALDDSGHLEITMPFDSFWTSEHTIKFYPGMRLFLLGESGGFIETSVLSVCAYKCSVVLDLQENNDRYLGVLQKNLDVSYTLKRGGDCFLLLNEHGMEATLYKYDGCTLVLEKAKNVECEIISSAIAPRGLYYSKSLYQLGFNLMGDNGGEIEIGYETDASVFKKTHTVESVLAFDKLDFNTLSYKADFSRCYTIRCFERDFKYIIFKVKHSEGRAFAFKSFMLSYATNGLVT